MSTDVSQILALGASLTAAGPVTAGRAALIVGKTAHDIEATAKTRAPVDTGNLRNSIGSDIRGLSAEIGPAAAYAAHVEYGTSRMAAQPYMGPAVDAVKPAFLAACEQLAGDALK